MPSPYHVQGPSIYVRFILRFWIALLIQNTVLIQNCVLIYRFDFHDLLNMPHYTRHKTIDMILILGEYRGNYRAAARLYRERYPHWRHPTYTVLRNCFQRAWQEQFVRFRFNVRNTLN